MNGVTTPFHTVLEAVEALSASERETLIEIVGKRLQAERRQQLLREINEAREEFRKGKLKPQSVEEIMTGLLP